MLANFHHAEVGITGRPRRADGFRRLAFERLLKIDTLHSVLCLDDSLLRFSRDRRIPGAENSFTYQTLLLGAHGKPVFLPAEASGFRTKTLWSSSMVASVPGRVSANW